MKPLTLFVGLVILSVSAGVAGALTPSEQALFEAANAGSLVDVERLVAQGTAVDVDGDTALTFARQGGHAEVVALLEKRSAEDDTEPK